MASQCSISNQGAAIPSMKCNIFSLKNISMDTSWVNRTLYPFSDHFLEIEGQQMHYVDEGSGPVILFAHGTPEWSFGWRELIADLRKEYRCIAPDMIGFGLSDKPVDGDYRVEAHAKRLEAFIQQLGLKDIYLIANDFGLSISLYSVIHHPQLFQKVSFFNGWMRQLDKDPHYSAPAKVMHGALGRFLYLRLNFPVNVITPAAFGDRKKLTPEVHRHYKRALSRPDERHGAYTFSRELLGAGSFWADLEAQLPKLSTMPFLIFWGMKDAFVPPSELAIWEKALPHAEVIRLEKAGHFAQEEAPEEMIAALRRFFR
ncbi:MAG: alpha/beta fold hydrolase [Bacteroidetes bacterium]|nr:MAG: alpha/beta fold hydrolase [Bacteroidota bacterium]